jgi:hypothetical protein
MIVLSNKILYTATIVSKRDLRPVDKRKGEITYCAAKMSPASHVIIGVLRQRRTLHECCVN